MEIPLPLYINQNKINIVIYKKCFAGEVKESSKPGSPVKKALTGKTGSKTGSVAPASGAVKAKTTKTVDSKVRN